MMGRRQRITFALLATIVIVLGIGVTLAYLTSNFSVTNKFRATTAESIDNELVEDNWEEPKDDLVPGNTIDKDPTVKAPTDLLDSHLRIKLTFTDRDGNNLTSAAQVNKIFSTLYYDPTYSYPNVGSGLIKGTSYSTAQLASFASVNPLFVKDVSRSSDPAVMYFNYANTLKARDIVTFFTSVAIPSDWKGSDFTVLGTRYNIVITGQSIQKEGLTPSQAWEALDNAENEPQSGLLFSPSTLPRTAHGNIHNEIAIPGEKDFVGNTPIQSFPARMHS